MPIEKMNMLIDKIKDMGNSEKDIKHLLACVYDLWQEYIITDDQEAELYALIDPNEKYNNVWDYWNDLETNELMDLIR